jgi:hypothetical protein
MLHQKGQSICNECISKIQNDMPGLIRKDTMNKPIDSLIQDKHL